jgi:hypothetical protein
VEIIVLLTFKTEPGGKNLFCSCSSSIPHLCVKTSACRSGHHETPNTLSMAEQKEKEPGAWMKMLSHHPQLETTYLQNTFIGDFISSFFRPVSHGCFVCHRQKKFRWIFFKKTLYFINQSHKETVTYKLVNTIHISEIKAQLVLGI